ncbi:MAG TPA: hypothetical protein PLT63_03530 [Syntrophales bacterium]|nr:hypothetical protein [Syntrophales bacterium]
MGKARFIYQNHIPDEDAFTVSSLQPGQVTAALKDGSGSASITVSGSFTGAVDKEYVIEIDSIAGGAEVGQATFKWSDGGGSWNASAVTTPSAPTELNSGVKVAFSSGDGADFVVGDRWYFKGINLFNAGKLIDLNRDSRYRSGSLEEPNTIDADMGSDQSVLVVVIFDHNFTSGAAISISGDSASTFDSGIGGAPEYSESIVWNEDGIVHYMTTPSTYRYWRLSVEDTSNSDGYIEIGELLIGSYAELSRNYNYEFSRSQGFIFTQNETAMGIRRARYYNARRIIEINQTYLTLSDISKLENMAETLNSKSAGTMKPFYFNFDSAVPNDTFMVQLTGLARERAGTAAELYHSPMTLEEVIKSD